MSAIVPGLVQVVETTAAMEAGISSGALLFMLVSMGAVITLTAWCFARILRTKEHFDPDGTGPAHAPVPGREESGGGS